MRLLRAIYVAVKSHVANVAHTASIYMNIIYFSAVRSDSA
jgi:hypothetical protein